MIVIHHKWKVRLQVFILKKHRTIWWIRAFLSICCCSCMSTKFYWDLLQTLCYCLEHYWWKTLPSHPLQSLLTTCSASSDMFYWSVFHISPCMIWSSLLQYSVSVSVKDFTFIHTWHTQKTLVIILICLYRALHTV